MDDENNFMARVLSLFIINMNPVIGKDFEQGLTNLNTVAQAKN